MHAREVANAKRRVPPGRVVIAGHRDDRRNGVELRYEFARGFEFVHARALRKVAGDDDRVPVTRASHGERGVDVCLHERVPAVNIR